MKNYEEKREIPVLGRYDVIVAGAGVAGVASALAAARQKRKVLLVEKSVMPGGLATLGHIAIYLPLCDGRGKKLIGGISEELLRDSIKYGYNSLPEEWASDTGLKKDTKKRYQTQFSPPEFIIAMEEKLLLEGVEILYDTVFSDVIMEGQKCTGVILENKSGRFVCECGAVVDATGDSDVFYKAGAECEEAGNWLSFWCYETNLSAMEKAVSEGDVKKGILLKPYGGDNEGKGRPADSRKYLGTDGLDVSRFIIDGRKIVAGKIKNRDPKKESLLAFPGMAQFRTTRRIHGIYTLSENDKGRTFEDSVGAVGDWRKSGEVYEVPYTSLISENADNIIAAGRNISSSGDAWEVTRVIPVAAMTGEAAGIAAAMLCGPDAAASFMDIDVLALQSELIEKGFLLHMK